MTTLQLPPLSPHTLRLRQADDCDRDRLQRLWLLFRHHMSEFTGALPNPDGTYRSDRLEAALSDPTWQAWLVPRPATRRVGDLQGDCAAVRPDCRLMCTAA
jgi:hypothetical protein